MTCYGTIGDYLGEMRGHYAFEGACSFTFLVYVHEKKKKTNIHGFADVCPR